MSSTIKSWAKALASVCRLVVAAERHGQDSISIAELRTALDGVDVQALGDPPPPRWIGSSRVVVGSPHGPRLDVR
jgi:hypothetical protein